MVVERVINVGFHSKFWHVQAKLACENLYKIGNY